MDFSKYFKPSLTSENAEAPRAFFVPFSSKEDAMTKSFRESDRYISLNGDWTFHYFETMLDVPEDVQNVDYDSHIPVPGCWQNSGYGQYWYTNISYQIPYIAPNVPLDTPVGIYRRFFNYQATNKKPYIVFEGVCSMYLVFINGQYVGMGKGSHLMHEFDIQPYVIDGINEIEVVVTTYSDATYLEDQDFLRFNGIFRDTYILDRDENHIEDFFIKATLDGTVSVSIEYSGMCDDPEIEIYDGDSKIDGMQVLNPVLWDAENPYLYRVVIKCGDEYITKKFGSNCRNFEQYLR
ncbi:MAG: hypothetical protein MJ236_04800, partial [Clostridia bacterium]|nr:hypothetical protein [Clostridia bacterium]